MKKDKLYRLLFVEDLPLDMKLAEATLKENGILFSSKRANTEEGFMKALKEFKPELIISEFTLDSFSGLRALKIAKQLIYPAPFIFFVRMSNTEKAIECMKAGASDYLPKKYIEVLPISLTNALENESIKKVNMANELALIESESKYHAIFESTGAATLIVDEDTTISMANNKCFQLTGYTPPELIGQKWVRFVAPGYLEQMQKNHMLRRLDPSKAPKVYEVKLINKSGELRDVLLDVGMIPNSKQSVVSISDITDQVKAENDLKLSESKYRLVIENSTNLFYTHTTDNALTFVSPQSTHFLDCTPEEAMVNWQYFLTDNPVNKAGIRNTKLAIKTGKAQPPYQLEILTLKGRKLWVEVNESPVLSDGKVVAITGSLTDMTQKKRLEFLLDESERDLKLFRALIESTNDSIQVIEPESSRILDINEANCRELGYSREELLSMSIPDINPTIDKAAFIKQVEAFDNSGLILIETTHKRKDGTIFPVELNIKYIVLDKPYIVTVARNITERKHSERLLKESEQNYKDIFYFAPVGIYQAERNGTIINANYKLAEMLGYRSIEDLKNLNMVSDVYFDPNERETLIGTYEPKGTVSNLEIRWKRKDGTLIWVLLSSHIRRNEKNEILLFEGFVKDITETKKAEEKLYLQSTALESAANGIIITDTEGNINWVNNAFVNLTGYSVDEVKGNSTRILSSGYQNSSFYKELWDRILSGNVWQGELINKRKDGSIYDEEMTITPVKDSHDNISHFIAIKQDITDRKQLQNELIKAKEKAELSNKLKDAFIANISHEIRTPLNGILGMTNLIKNSLTEYIREDENHYFIAIDKSSARIVRTIDMILNFSRLQIGEFPVSLKQVNIPLVIGNLIKEYGPKADGKSLKLLFENMLEDVTIEADEYCIAQTISNLIDNALKYTLKGSVLLTLYKDNENNVLLDVKDTGIGISEGYLDSIFEPYTQEETGYSRSYEGVGLGMSLVKRYLDLNGAEITVTSKKNEGTVFTINFRQAPSVVSDIVQSSQLSNAVSDVKAVPKKVKNSSILVIEDDAINQLYILSLLKKSFNTDSAFSAELALKKMESKKYDLILMDISLKGEMNGLELTKLLRQTKEYINTPMIAITGHASEVDRQNCLDAGCNEFISKPFSSDQLLNLVLQFVR